MNATSTAEEPSDLNGFALRSAARLFHPIEESDLAALRALAGWHQAAPRANGAAPSDQVLEQFRGTAIPDVGWELSRYVELLGRDVVPGAVAMSSPRCLAHMTTPVPSAMAPLTELLVALNQNLVRADASATLSLLERQTLGMLHRLVFQRNGRFYLRHVQRPGNTLGMVVSGATLANLTALWCARNAALAPAGVREVGLAGALADGGYRGAAIVGSESMHYSFTKAADLLGIGTANLVRVPLDSDDRVDPRALRRAVHRCQQSGRLVLAVVGVAGTTNSGAVDPLADVAEVAEEAGCHFHVDAAWGGPVLLSPRERHRLAGIARADTVTLDGHKQFRLPVGAGFLLFRNPSLAVHLEHAAPYAVRRGSPDLGLRSPEGSRPGIAMLLHAALHLFGRSGYAELIDLAQHQTGYLADRLRANPRFELLRDPQLNIVLYRYLPPADSDRSDLPETDALNVAIHRVQRQRGNALVSRTTTTSAGREVVALRAVLANPLTTLRDLDAVLAEQEYLGRVLERGLLDPPRERD